MFAGFSTITYHRESRKAKPHMADTSCVRSAMQIERLLRGPGTFGLRSPDRILGVAKESKQLPTLCYSVP